MSWNTACWLLLFGSMFCARNAVAQDSEDPERPPDEGPSSAKAGVHEHDGFLLRLAVGFGYESLSIDNTTLSGPGAGLNVAVGGMLADNFALNADIYSAAVVSPSVTVDGSDLGDAGDTTLTLSGLGIGATYFIMPINIYLAASLGIGVVGITIDGTDYESDAGFATNVMIGKEFWVADDWGIGFAGQLMYAAVPRADTDGTLPFVGFNLMFSATYN